MTAGGRDRDATPWLCERCGYLIDLADAIDDSGNTPQPGDLLLCMNCATPYTLEGTAWRLMSPIEIAALAPEERRALASAANALARARLPDLTADDGRT